SWKTGASPILAACAGDLTRASAPSIRIVPVSRRRTPVRILTSVLFPAPFAPSRACASPAPTTRSAPFSATTGPKRFATARASRSAGSAMLSRRRGRLPAPSSPSDRSLLQRLARLVLRERVGRPRLDLQLDARVRREAGRHELVDRRPVLR